MTVYHGIRTATQVIIGVSAGHFDRPLHHVRYHSPTGMEWGYGGSGPADLALSILVDHLRERPLDVQCELRGLPGALNPSRAMALHQDFKWAYVATWGAIWTISSAELDRWLGEQTDG